MKHRQLYDIELPLFFHHILRKGQPLYHSFRHPKGDLRTRQEATLMRIVHRNRHTEYGQRYGFDRINGVEDFQNRVPIVDYEDIVPEVEAIMTGAANVLSADPVSMFVPTSGSATASKYIPYTKTLLGDFQQMLYIWMYDLYRHLPQIAGGQAFWVFSPIVQPPPIKSYVPIQFPTDDQYFDDPELSLYLNKLLAVPPLAALLRNPEQYLYAVSLFLLSTEHLTWISLWSPTLLIVLLQHIVDHREDLLRDIHDGTVKGADHWSNDALRMYVELMHRPNRARADECARLLTGTTDYHQVPWYKLWPKLQLISCWGDAWARQPWDALKELFPNTYFQPKGLLATEGIATIPLIDTRTRRSRPVLCADTHFFEFYSTSDGTIRTADQLRVGEQYELLLTTSAGLYRYRLRDIVECIEKDAYNVSIQLVGKADIVSDLCGEKLHVQFVEDVLQDMRKFFPSATCVVVPVRRDGVRYYTLVIIGGAAPPASDRSRILRLLDELLSQNVHYKNCRELQQLQPPRLAYLTTVQWEKALAHGGHGAQWNTTKRWSLYTNLTIGEKIAGYETG